MGVCLPAYLPRLDASTLHGASAHAWRMWPESATRYCDRSVPSAGQCGRTSAGVPAGVPVVERQLHLKASVTAATDAVVSRIPAIRSRGANRLLWGPLAYHSRRSLWALSTCYCCRVVHGECLSIGTKLTRPPNLPLEYLPWNIVRICRPKFAMMTWSQGTRIAVSVLGNLRRNSVWTYDEYRNVVGGIVHASSVDVDTGYDCSADDGGGRLPVTTQCCGHRRRHDRGHTRCRCRHPGHRYTVVATPAER